MCWVYVQVTRSTPVQLHASLVKQATTENREDKWRRNPNIPPGWLDGMHSTDRDIPNFVYKPMSRKYHSNVSPFCCGLLVDFIYVHSFQCLLAIRVCSLPWLAKLRMLIPSPNTTEDQSLMMTLRQFDLHSASLDDPRSMQFRTNETKAMVDCQSWGLAYSVARKSGRKEKRRDEVK